MIDRPEEGLAIKQDSKRPLYVALAAFAAFLVAVIGVGSWLMGWLDSPPTFGSR